VARSLSTESDRPGSSGLAIALATKHKSDEAQVRSRAVLAAHLLVSKRPQA